MLQINRPSGKQLSFTDEKGGNVSTQTTSLNTH